MLSLSNINESTLINTKLDIEIDNLLIECVERNNYHAILLIINFIDYIENLQSEQLMFYDSRPTKCNIKSSKALILAAQKGNYHIIKLFLVRGFHIPEPHLFECHCSICRQNKLGQTRSRISILKALVNPVYVSLTSNNPFLTLFKICNSSKVLSKQEDCFEKIYKKLMKKSQQVCFDLLDQLETENEVLTLMTCGENDRRNNADISFHKLAIQYGQKQVVSHPIPQHVLTSLVFDRFPRWHSSSVITKIIGVLLLTVLFPITSLVHILFPCSYVGRMVKDPLLKFINGAGSFFTFLALLAYIATAEKCGIRLGQSPTWTDYVLFTWNISLLVQEIRQLLKEGQLRYFTCGWNWIDIFMVTLMLIAQLMWLIIYIFGHKKDNNSQQFILSCADGLFAFSIVLNFFRMVYLCQITRFLGLLQLCLGRMLQVIFQFAFISCVVLWSFSAGMVFLFHSSAKYDQVMADLQQENQNKTFVYEYLSGGYNGLIPTMVTLAWASMSMTGIESLKGLDDGTMIHICSYFLFTLYHGVSMIVLLNMLIAMMSNSYQQIENNIEVEHKYARTKLWLEYIGDDHILPCPFNLVPTYGSVKKMYDSIKQKICNAEQRNFKDTSQTNATNDYQNICKILFQRYLKKIYGANFQENIIPDQSKTVDIFVLEVEEKIKSWSAVLENMIQDKQNYIHREENNGIENTSFVEEDDDDENEEEGCTEVEGTK